jgi:hypothetical protein
MSFNVNQDLLELYWSWALDDLDEAPALAKSLAISKFIDPTLPCTNIPSTKGPEPIFDHVGELQPLD